MCRIGSWCARSPSSSRQSQYQYIPLERVFFFDAGDTTSRQNGGGKGTMAAYPFPIGFILATTISSAGRACAHSPKIHHSAKKPRDLIYTNVPDGLYISSELCLQQIQECLPFICISLSYIPDITISRQFELLYGVDPSSTDIWFSLCFRKQQQRNCLRRQVRRDTFTFSNFEFRQFC